MSIFYDPHTKRPLIWIYPFFLLIIAGMIVGVYLYGDQKAKKISPRAEKDTLFEKVEE